ncbi:MAG: hypothetical protein QXO15_00220 [Nitrososphaerota archaeon]
MNWPLKLALHISFISTMLLVAFLLIAFVNQVTYDPRCIGISVKDVEFQPDGKILTKVVLHHSLGIPLSKVRIMIGNTTLAFENVRKGSSEKDVVLTLDDLEQGVKEVDLEVAGLFKLSVKFGRGGERG